MISPVVVQPAITIPPIFQKKIWQWSPQPRMIQFAIHRELRTVSLIANEAGLPSLLEQVSFQETELRLLIALLVYWPAYCPFEELYASFYANSQDEAARTAARQHLKRARETDQWRQEVGPIRNALSRTRKKIKAFTSASYVFDIISVFDEGYLLEVRTREEKGSPQ
ncbi:hypothetical protein [Dictyobacter arantiisoli]|uniref:Uncharacterized protein n=1 Tax=Dictyobacter arantiisoli TaxID=2014874 RepID=A0A5A5TI05_9CHLR|nr:hypothetical protein [Dictyobacter arantiisoli]GCF11231.1 hypothetical protein KDI_47950 [Dictyobacter arantiisoli]